MQHFPIPVEIVPLAATPIRKELEALGASVQIRQHAGSIFFTENCNIILDCRFLQGTADLQELQHRIKSIIGVVETGLFLHMAREAFIGGPEGVHILSR
jgi:ribose 5-phosphate isomerase A